MSKNYIIAPVKFDDPMQSARVLDLSKSARINPKGKNYSIGPSKDFLHSALGTTWEKHDYIKVQDGKYYYPDDYKGGRHLPKGDNDYSELIKSSEGEPSNWEAKFYSEFEQNLKRIGGKLDPREIQELLLFGKNKDGSGYDNFAVALAEHAGIDSDKIDPAVLNRMRYKVVEHYRQQFLKEKENFDDKGNRIKDRTAEQEKAISKSSSKKSSGSKKSSSGSKKESNKKTKSASAIKKVAEINETNGRTRGRRKGAVRGRSGYIAGKSGGGF